MRWDESGFQGIHSQLLGTAVSGAEPYWELPKQDVLMLPWSRESAVPLQIGAGTWIPLVGRLRG